MTEPRTSTDAASRSHSGPSLWSARQGSSTGAGISIVEVQIRMQKALLTLGKTRVSLAITTRFNPSHAYGKETLRGVAARLLRGLWTASSTSVRGRSPSRVDW